MSSASREPGGPGRAEASLGEPARGERKEEAPRKAKEGRKEPSRAIQGTTPTHLAQRSSVTLSNTEGTVSHAPALYESGYPKDTLQHPSITKLAVVITKAMVGGGADTRMSKAKVSQAKSDAARASKAKRVNSAAPSAVGRLRGWGYVLCFVVWRLSPRLGSFSVVSFASVVLVPVFCSYSAHRK